MTSQKEFCNSNAPPVIYYYGQLKNNITFKNYWCELEAGHEGSCKCDEYEWIKVDANEQ